MYQKVVEDSYKRDAESRWQLTMNDENRDVFFLSHRKLSLLVKMRIAVRNLLDPLSRYPSNDCDKNLARETYH